MFSNAIRPGLFSYGVDVFARFVVAEITGWMRRPETAGRIGKHHPLLLTETRFLLVPWAGTSLVPTHLLTGLVNIVNRVVNVEFTGRCDKEVIFDDLFQLQGLVINDNECGFLLLTAPH